MLVPPTNSRDGSVCNFCTNTQDSILFNPINKCNHYNGWFICRSKNCHDLLKMSKEKYRIKDSVIENIFVKNNLPKPTFLKTPIEPDDSTGTVKIQRSNGNIESDCDNRRSRENTKNYLLQINE